MDEQLIDENKRRVQKSNFLLVCSVLSIYCICVVAVLGMITWGIQYETEAFAIANATQQANATATAIVHATAQSQYEFIEPFDQSSARWYVGTSAKQYGDAFYSIKDGVYVWDIRKSEGYIFSIPFYKGNKIENFDAYVDTKFLEHASKSAVCAGFAFLKTRDTWRDGEFVFVLCNNTRVRIHYHDEDGWELIASRFMDTIHPEDWNRMELSVREGRFVFLVNSFEIFEMTDNRIIQGNLSIYLDVPEDESAEVWFDNFGYQPR